MKTDRHQWTKEEGRGWVYLLPRDWAFGQRLGTCPGTGRQTMQRKGEGIEGQQRGEGLSPSSPASPVPNLESFPPDRQSRRERAALSPRPSPPHLAAWGAIHSTLSPGCFSARVPAASPATWPPGLVLEAVSIPGPC